MTIENEHKSVFEVLQARMKSLLTQCQERDKLAVPIVLLTERVEKVLSSEDEFAVFLFMIRMTSRAHLPMVLEAMGLDYQEIVMPQVGDDEAPSNLQDMKES